MEPANQYELGEVEAALGDEVQEYGRRISKLGDRNSIKAIRDWLQESNGGKWFAYMRHYKQTLGRVRRLKAVCNELEKIVDELR